MWPHMGRRDAVGVASRGYSWPCGSVGQLNLGF